MTSPFLVVWNPWKHLPSLSLSFSPSWNPSFSDFLGVKHVFFYHVKAPCFLVNSCHGSKANFSYETSPTFGDWSPRCRIAASFGRIAHLRRWLRRSRGFGPWRSYSVSRLCGVLESPWKKWLASYWSLPLLLNGPPKIPQIINTWRSF